MESQKKYWNIDPMSGALLQTLIHTHKPKHILEIGTSNGYSAILMGHVAQQYGGKIQTIEFFEERIKLARENIQKEELQETIEVLRGDAMEILPTLLTSPNPAWPAGRPSFVRRGNAPYTPPYEGGVGGGSSAQSFDFVFLDANKEEYAAYFKYAMKLIVPNGIIVADNTISHRNKLSAFFEAVANEPRANTLELEIGSGLMIITVLQQYQ